MGVWFREKNVKNKDPSNLSLLSVLTVSITLKLKKYISHILNTIKVVNDTFNIISTFGLHYPP
jgi:hypothetical protein